MASRKNALPSSIGLESVPRREQAAIAPDAHRGRKARSYSWEQHFDGETDDRNVSKVRLDVRRVGRIVLEVRFDAEMVGRNVSNVRLDA